ncbi:MAG: calcium-binding EGF-like domain-containing protein [Chitinophagales bacterium]|nr:calcium-binding EGF-like domain-containing protein [Chitinophagaceae bacterium]MCB9065052.1 calcium-binding EGF-like domain-containing protein [Chitinophagales bacterium]
MIGRLKHISLTTFITLSIFALVYTSCKKDTYTYIDECKNVTCQNGGTCFKGQCSCPAGFEGENCESAWLSRYLGNWQVDEVVSLSNRNGRQGQTSRYNMTIKKNGGSNTGFLIDNFMGNADYNNVPCRVAVKQDGGSDSPTNFIFTAQHPISNSIIVIEEGDGTVNYLGNVLSGKYTVFYTQLITPDSPIVVRETISFTATQ